MIPLSCNVVAVDWYSYSSQHYHVLWASPFIGHSLPLLSRIIHSIQQNNILIQNEYLIALAKATNPNENVIILTDAGFHHAGFQHINLWAEIYG